MGCLCSTSSILYSFCFFLLVGFLTCSCPKADGIEEATHHVVQVQSLLPTDVCTPSKELGPSQLQVVHRHGPCSPLNNNNNNNSAEEKKKKKNKHKHKRTQLQILKKDQIRVDWLQSKRTPSVTTKSKPKPNSSLAAAAATKIPARTGSSLGTGNYIVTLGFGTPKIPQSVCFDTGSDVTWIQCQPCVGSCYSQQDQLFNPTKSSTYLNISCASPYCAALDTSGCDGSSCLYAVQYGDNSYTVGFFAQDTLTLSPSDVIPGFRFGCGENNIGLFGRTAGLLGLGRGEQASLVTQTASKYGGVFSYCLPSSSSSTGYLSFGGGPASNVQFTPMLSESGGASSFYFLELVAISVGGQRLAIPPTVFSTAGVILDSGTVITRLPPTAYSALRAAFRKRMTQYPAAPAVSLFDTCYDFSKYTTITIPTVALNFKGADVSLDFSGILYVRSSTQACLAFAANGDDGDLAIVGNTQQRKMSVVYDVTKQLIGFGTAPGC